jgi:hypothetical protein
MRCKAPNCLVHTAEAASDKLGPRPRETGDGPGSAKLWSRERPPVGLPSCYARQ